MLFGFGVQKLNLIESVLNESALAEPLNNYKNIIIPLSCAKRSSFVQGDFLGPQGSQWNAGCPANNGSS
jgi:hypothetical protein